MTRILVISDVHANMAALEAVLADAGQVDQTWCLGDVVGYGPQPNECIDSIRSLPNLTCIKGNHDYAASQGHTLEAFNGDARRALLWQRDQLTRQSLDFLLSLEEKKVVPEGVTLVHGSPRDPIWEYVLNTLVARLCLGSFETQLCFVGHSHFQVIFEYQPAKDEVSLIAPQAGKNLVLESRAILNPGSVGQPRDRDPRAAYAIFNPEEKTWLPCRVAYDIASVQKLIHEAGLPSRHADRLSGGW